MKLQIPIRHDSDPDTVLRQIGHLGRMVLTRILLWLRILFIGCLDLTMLPCLVIDWPNNMQRLSENNCSFTMFENAI